MDLKNTLVQTAALSDVGHFDLKLKEVQAKLHQLNPYVHKTTVSKPIIDHALEYAKHGYKVLPLHFPNHRQKCSCGKKSCSSVGKHPITKNGLKDASSEFSKIQEWWGNFPTANIGILTGSISRFVVLDIDKDHGGFESLKALQTSYETLPITRKVESGGGGLHIYFACTKVLKNRVGILPGIDFRGEGAYIVAPPSIHLSGKKYTWSDENLDFAPLPLWLEELISSNAESREKPSIKKPMQEGVRNNSLTSIAGFLRRQSLDHKHIAEALHALNPILCEPALEKEEVSKIAKSIAGYEKPQPWSKALALPKSKVEVKKLTNDMLPNSLRPWIVDVAERMQIPLEYLATPAIVAAASIIGRKITIRPIPKDSWCVIPNLWGFIVGDPGSMKSPAIAEAMRPLEKIAKRSRDDFRRECRERQADERNSLLQIESLKESLKVNFKSGNASLIAKQKEELTKLLDSREPPKEKRYKTNDPTVEKLAVILQENPNGILLLRDELSGWLETLNKAGREGSREFYLEAWNGNSSYTVDRIGRGTQHVDALCLSIFGSIQPAKLEEYIENTVSSKGDDGFLERFQMIVYPEKPKSWILMNKSPNEDAEKEAFAVFEHLDKFSGNEFHIDSSSSIPFLLFSESAQILADAWRLKLETRLLEGQDSNIFQAHLSKYRSLMPSLALVFTMLRSSSTKIENVGVEETRMAISWCDFLESHAKKIYEKVINEEKAYAQVLAEKIQEQSVYDGEKIRDIYRRNWRGINTQEKLEKAIKHLTTLGWVRTEVIKALGGRSEVLRINPELLQRKGVSHV